ncbi:MAG TPA: hypothetical protein PLJ27_19640 [Polyangiaceae bacterium]|jgi:Kef-type K+ transport system membrane component KefB|nr:MAG: Sodium/hydrogen exchanger family protein [Deltaproteobacteria bacterium ADurb.Bin207]HNS97231.1 hypothetical protein [Polyangiaceae bacterium]HNZ23109.1 hypothetical protein [Polyangiaceae bacterium]HOD22161.1 hypothetical protein [Polyangiaceae bacterium]HOE49390.1 hypothetical protein [Polyangiaceae bacterium]
MSVTILLVLVVIFSFAFGHLLTRYVSRYIALSGAEYLLVGLLIGPQVPPRLMTHDSLALLEPFIALLLGLVGFVVALHTRDVFRNLRITMVGLVSATFVLLIVAGAMLFLADRLLVPAPGSLHFEWEIFRTQRHALVLTLSTSHLWMSLALGAAACVASPFVIDSAARMLKASGPVTELLHGSATLSQVLAVIVVGVAATTARSTDTATGVGLSAGMALLTAVVVGVICGLLFTLFIGQEKDAVRIFLATAGAVIFASGVGTALGLSPLFVNLVAGITVALTSRHTQRLRDELDRLQHPLFVLIMIFGGALWAPVEGWVWLLPIFYIAVRYAVRRAFTRLTVRVVAPSHVLSPRIGLGLLSQGTMAVAIGVDFSQRFPHYSASVLTTVLAGTLVSDLWSARSLRSVLLDAGESAHDSLPASTRRAS